jgi:hypothetical protein
MEEKYISSATPVCTEYLVQFLSISLMDLSSKKELECPCSVKS